VAEMDAPVGFLYRTAMNLFRKRLRRAGVAVRKAVHLLPGHDGLAEVETRDEAVRLLQRLTPRERAAIVVTAYLGYSSEEAGELLGIQATTVRVLTNRARATLRGVEEVSG
jgi:RNA polymerase sigma-70 factor, ECF subfamily